MEKEIRNLENEFFINKVINQFNENNRNDKWYNHKPLRGWYKMNYPNKFVSNLYAFKKENIVEKKIDYNFNFQKEKIIDENKIYNIKDYNKLNNINKKKDGKDYNDLLIENEFILGSVDLKYKFEITENNNKNCKLYSIYAPISAGIRVKEIKDSYYEFKELVWNKQLKLKKNIKLAYKTELERHCQHYGTEIITDQSMIPLLNKRLLYLDLKNYNFLDINIISKIGFHSPNLVFLSLENLKINNEILNDIYLNLNNLEILNINNCEEINDDFLKNLYLKKNLIGFHCKKNKYLKNYHLLKLKLENFKELDISDCENIDENFFKKWSKKEYLSLEYFKFKNNKNNIDFDHLNSIFGKVWKSLKYLNMSNCEFNFDKKNILNLMKCKKLINLNLKGNNKINYSNCFSSIEGSFVNLKKMNLSKMNELNEGCLGKIILSCYNIEIFIVNDNESFTNNNFLLITNNLKKIKILSIFNCKNFNKAENINDYDFHILFEQNIPYEKLKIPLPIKGHKRPNPKAKKKR